MLLPRLISVARPRMVWPKILLPLFLVSAAFLGTGATSLRAQGAPLAPSSQTTPPAAPQPSQPQAVHLKDYSIPRSAFPRMLQPYTPQQLAAAQPRQLAPHRLALAGWQNLSLDR